jgi:hypothetical protein
MRGLHRNLLRQGLRVRDANRTQAQGGARGTDQGPDSKDARYQFVRHRTPPLFLDRAGRRSDR